MTQIIGLVGFKQSGKSTAATHLEQKYGFVRHNFKDALVAEIKEKFPDLLREIENQYFRNRFFACDISLKNGFDLFTTKPPLMRALMQNYGTEVRRKDDPDYWVKEWIDKLHYLADMCGHEKFVTDDVRFLNEANAIKMGSGTIIRLVRTDITTGGDHKSETEQLEIVPDHTITVGPGEHDKLYTALDEILALHELQ
jgi:hypothetical protein